MASATIGTKRSFAAMSKDSRSSNSELSALHDVKISEGYYPRQRQKQNIEESCEWLETAASYMR